MKKIGDRLLVNDVREEQINNESSSQECIRDMVVLTIKLEEDTTRLRLIVCTARSRYCPLFLFFNCLQYCKRNVYHHITASDTRTKRLTLNCSRTTAYLGLKVGPLDKTSTTAKLPLEMANPRGNRRVRSKK